jgi:hypothetical protein
MQPIAQPLVPLPMEVIVATAMVAFDIEVEQVCVVEVRMVVTCGQAFCDGRYGCTCVCTRHSAPLLTVPTVVFMVDGVELRGPRKPPLHG